VILPRPQFGSAAPDLYPVDRPAVFGLLERDGRLAAVKVSRAGEVHYHDLPGGAIEAGEDELQAVVREFAEETGLIVRPVERIAQAGQYFRRSDGTPVNNIGGFWTVRQVGEDAAAKVEDDHELVWLTPAEAVGVLRHDAHAWAVTAWLRSRRT
jgi:8-oxo-dGTP diphosphatase